MLNSLRCCGSEIGQHDFGSIERLEPVRHLGGISMKKITLGLLVVLATGLYAFGADCIVASYDTYIGTSCGIDDKTLSEFSYSTSGTTQLPASSITVNPINTPFNPGLLFNAPWGAQAGETQGSMIGFTVTVNPGGNLIDDLSLYMFGAGVLGTGQVSVAETYCAGDTFANGCANGITGSLLTILNSGTSILTAHATFDDPVSILDVRKDIELLGGSDGSAALVSGVQNQFSEVPEPGSLVLFGSGIVGLAGVLRRYVRL